MANLINQAAEIFENKENIVANALTNGLQEIESQRGGFINGVKEFIKDILTAIGIEVTRSSKHDLGKFTHDILEKEQGKKDTGVARE